MQVYLLYLYAGTQGEFLDGVFSSPSAVMRRCESSAISSFKIDNTKAGEIVQALQDDYKWEKPGLRIESWSVIK